MTPEQSALNHIHMYGCLGLDAFVYSYGKGRYWVEIGGFRTPMVFKTKRAARRHAEARIYASNGINIEPHLYDFRATKRASEDANAYIAAFTR